MNPTERGTQEKYLKSSGILHFLLGLELDGSLFTVTITVSLVTSVLRFVVDVFFGRVLFTGCSREVVGEVGPSSSHDSSVEVASLSSMSARSLSISLVVKN